jgi:hypothetical protein
MELLIFIAVVVFRSPRVPHPYNCSLVTRELTS